MSVINGTKLPTKIEEHLHKTEQEEKEKKAQRRHDYFVAAFSSFCGGIMGLLTSFIFWLCTK